MPTSLCPWLGIATDPEIRYAEPDEAHVCWAQEPPGEVAVAYQTEFCLAAAYQTCPLYRDSRTRPDAVARIPGAPGDDVGPPPPRLSLTRLVLWLLALGVAVAAAVVYVRLLGPAGPPQTASVSATAPLSPSVTTAFWPSGEPTATPSPTQALAFIEPTATPTPVPGGSIYRLRPEAGYAGWVASDESRGNHLGDSYLYSGVFDGVVYHGVIQIDLSSLARGATIHAAFLEITGLDARRLGATGTWEVRLLERDVDEDWTRLTFQSVHNTAVEWSLTPVLSVSDTEVGGVNSFTFPPELLRVLEQRLLDEHYTVSLRIDGPQAGDNSVFAWDSGYGPATQGESPRLLLSVGPAPLTPLPTGTQPFVVVTSTPTPANVLTAAAWAHTATANAVTTGQPTPTSVRQWTATPQRVITSTPTPATQATSDYLRSVATAIAFTTGTFTPVPDAVVTATQTPVTIAWEELTPTPTPLPPAPTPPLPPVLQGQILFRSNRAGGAGPWVMDPDGRNVALLTAPWPYDVAASMEALSPDGRHLVLIGRADGQPAVLTLDLETMQTRTLVPFESGQPSSPVWSPQGDLIAFVSTASGQAQIWLVTTSATGLRQLTSEAWGSAAHPSFSPDGRRLAYTSTDAQGRRQVWVIGLDGTGRMNLSYNSYDEWDPVWIE